MKNNLRLAIQAALEAGKEILEVYSSNFQVEIKEDDSPVTIADKKADQIITDYLNLTSLPIISEESPISEYEQRKDWQQFWLVDPLDGTKEFIKRNGEFTVNIALIEKNNPVLGVIYVPVDGSLYFTAADGKSLKKIMLESNNMTADYILQNAKTIKPSPTFSILKVLCSRSHQNSATLEFIEDLRKTNQVEILNKGSSLKFGILAEGSAHIYPRFGPTMEWDTAAGDAICSAVGLSVIDQKTKSKMQYNKPSLLNNDFVVKSF